MKCLHAQLTLAEKGLPLSLFMIDLRRKDLGSAVYRSQNMCQEGRVDEWHVISLSQRQWWKPRGTGFFPINPEPETVSDRYCLYTNLHSSITMIFPPGEHHKHSTESFVNLAGEDIPDATPYKFPRISYPMFSIKTCFKSPGLLLHCHACDFYRTGVHSASC